MSIADGDIDSISMSITIRFSLKDETQTESIIERVSPLVKSVDLLELRPS